MNRINSLVASIGKVAFVSSLVITATLMPIAYVFAQDDGSYDTGSSGYDGSYDTGSAGYDGSYDTGSTGYDGSYDTGATGYDGSYDTGTGYDGSYDTGSGSTYGNGVSDGTYGTGYADGTYGDGTADGTYGTGTADGTYGTGYADGTYGSGYANSTTPSYSYTAPTYSSGTGYSSTPSYSVTNPSYASSVYTSPATGYSTNIFGTAGTGYSVPMIYTPTPTTHTTAPTQIVYTTPTQQTTPVTTQTQPIVINNNNTNTNTNSNPNTNTVTNTNTAPVASVYSAPVQYVTDYVYPVSCSITASPTVVVAGQSTILSWSSSAATSAYLSNGIGSVSTNGTIAARPGSSMNYILTVYGQNGQSSTCNVTVSVTGYAVNPINTINPSSSVSLTQIPYTGFDFGPVGDAIYWAALMSFAVAAAYLLVYYRGGAFTLAGAMIGRNSSIKPVRFTEVADDEHEAPMIEETPVIEALVVNARIASVIHNLPTAEVRRMTSDAMIVNHSTNGEAPRIVITRA